MRYNFSELFDVSGGMISPKVPVQIGGATMGPGVSLGSGVSFGDISLHDYIGKDLEVSVQNGVHVITGHYQ